jgi:hypothetical protein
VLEVRKTEATVTFSLGWASKARYWLAGLAGGAFLSAALEAGASRTRIVTSRSGIFGKRWDFMAKLIMIFAGARGKARGTLA